MCLFFFFFLSLKTYLIFIETHSCIPVGTLQSKDECQQEQFTTVQVGLSRVVRRTSQG